MTDRTVPAPTERVGPERLWIMAVQPTVVFDSDSLYIALDRKRRADKLTWRDIARTTGVPASTFTRLGQGKHLSLANLVKVLGWLGAGTDLAPYLTRPQRPS